MPGIRGGVRFILGGREFRSRTEGKDRGACGGGDPLRRRDVGGENPNASDGKRADYPKRL